MRKMLLLCPVLLATILSPVWAAAHPELDEEEILFIRHGEKPSSGLGQLSCQGLNRAMALPKALLSTVSKIDAVWAANPAPAKEDDGSLYSYVRPLATVEPTAIALGLPVNAQIGLDQADKLVTELDDSRYDGKVVLVSWEHKQIVAIARALLTAHGGNAATVPKWPKDDFDTIDVVWIKRSPSTTSVKFEQRHEGLNGQAASCPH